MKIIKTPEQLLDEICEVTGIKVKQIRAKSKKRDLVIVRQYYAYFGMEFFNFSCTLLAININQDHSTLIHGKQVIKDLIDSGFDKVVNDVSALLAHLEISNEENYLYNLEMKYKSLLKEMTDWKRKVNKLELENKCYEKQLRKMKKQLSNSQNLSLS
jgi:hypothetical protein